MIKERLLLLLCCLVYTVSSLCVRPVFLEDANVTRMLSVGNSRFISYIGLNINANRMNGR